MFRVENIIPGPVLLAGIITTLTEMLRDMPFFRRPHFIFFSGPRMRVIDYIQRHQLFPPDEVLLTSSSFIYLGMNPDRSKLIVLLPAKGLFVAVECEPYKVITGPLFGDCPTLG